MDRIKKNFGFGCMRLPMKDSEVDYREFSKMVDEFLLNGFNYFDTAHGYLGGKSETALKICLTSRYPRDRYILTNKLTNFFFKKQEDIRPFFESQRKACGVESRKCYEVCRKFGKPVIVMEPVKGGSLVNLPENAKAVLDELWGGSPASYAIRFAAGFEGIMMVLSGMSDMAQMRDNISYMKDFQPLSEKELAAVGKVQEIFKAMNLIPCTSCRYCVAGCPKQIAIPDLFAVMNTKQIYHDWNADYYYNVVHTGGGKAKASECIKCGKCEKACPQHLHIRNLLVDVAKEFETR